VQDGTRRDHSFRQRQHEWYLRELRRSGGDYLVLEGSVAQRTAQAIAALVLQELPTHPAEDE
jgi:HTH-type transcriptional repressor of NAD biosynthesis genes